MGSLEKPLLPESTGCQSDENGENATSNGVAVGDHSGSAGLWTEVRKQFDLAGSLVIANLMQYSIWVIATMFVGHLGVLQLSSAALATSFASVTGFTVLVCASHPPTHAP